MQGVAVGHLKVSELRNYLKMVNGDMSGSKEALVGRLQQYCVSKNITSLNQLALIKSDDSLDEPLTPNKVRIITKSNTEKGCMSWEIHQFSSLNLAPGEKIKSSSFVVGKKKWQVHLYPCGDKEDNKNVTCYLHYLEEGEESVRARWRASFTTKSVREVRPSLELQFVFGAVKSRGWRGIIQKTGNFLGPEDILIIESEVEIYTDWVTSDCTVPNIEKPAPIVADQNDWQAEMETMVGSKLFSDVSFIVEGETIPAHKNILCSRSPVFRSMFTCGMKESSADSVNIDDIEIVIMKEMLRFLYCGKVDESILQERTFELLCIADKYDVAGLREKCAQVLQQRMTRNNALSILSAADMYHTPALKAHALNAISKNFMQVIVTDSWKEFCVNSPHLVAEVTDALAKSTTSLSPSDENNNLKRKRSDL